MTKGADVNECKVIGSATNAWMPISEAKGVRTAINVNAIKSGRLAVMQ